MKVENKRRNVGECILIKVMMLLLIVAAIFIFLVFVFTKAVSLHVYELQHSVLSQHKMSYIISSVDSGEDSHARLNDNINDSNKNDARHDIIQSDGQKPDDDIAVPFYVYPKMETIANHLIEVYI